VGIGERVRAVHLSQYCPGGLGFPAGSPGAAQPAPGDGPSWGELAGHEAQAAGRRCARCGHEISAGQPARRRADHDWVHGDCRPAA
jgi:hypothetical protein